MYERIRKCLCPDRYIGGAKNTENIIDVVNDNKDELLKQYKSFAGLSQEELIRKLVEAEAKAADAEAIAFKEKKIRQNAEKALEGALAEKKENIRIEKNIDVFNLLNLYKFFNKYDEGLLFHPDEDKRAKDEDGNYIIDPSTYLYDPFNTTYDKNINKYREHQKRFISDWSVSAQELVIMYYGVGTGKTLIAITCAEEYTRINKESYVYFLMPSSLILNTILEMFKFGIDPTIEDSKGNKIYNFISYAQLMRTDFKFLDNSLLIVDEVHNLRNLYTQEINDKISARKYKPTGNYSLIGSVLASKLLDNSNSFIRKIFMTGTLFVNSSLDLEPIISIGYNKRPLLKLDKDEYETIQNDKELFKNYYQGLISFYRTSGEALKSLPTVKYHFEIVNYPGMSDDFNEIKKDPYFLNTRTLGASEKIEWIVKFLSNPKNKNKKTLIYTQFIDKSMRPITAVLKQLNIPFESITGSLSMEQRMNIVDRYNRDEIKVLLFTLAIKEGISFKETDNFIIYNPYWNYSILEQVIARGIRLTSHSKGSQSIINIYFLCAVDEDDSRQDNLGITHTPEDFIFKANEFMNNDIKKLEYNINEKGEIEYPFYTNFQSRDIDLYIRMFNKQNEINKFEKKLLALPSFEDVNNSENNEFIKVYNQALINYQTANGKLPNNKEMIELKKRLYKTFYDNVIEKNSKNITRFSNDPNYKKNRNPDLLEEANYSEYPNLEDDIRTLIRNGSSLDNIFEKFKIDKQTITTFQANFTPLNHINKLLKLSNISNDKSKTIKILEPTAGIGNVINGLSELSNKQNFMIDCNELNQVFYQVGKVLYEDLDNVIWSNLDFMDYISRYNYDYIIGNPPFNLRVNKMVEGKQKDFTLYDIHFVEKAYNMLSDYGTLAFIISSRFQRDETALFKSFNKYIEEIKKVDNDYVLIEPLETGFEKDKKITKEMTTNYGMVYIIIKKLPDYVMNLSKPLNAIYDVKERFKVKKEKPDEYKEVKEVKEVKEKKKKKSKKEIEAEKKALDDKIKESIIQEVKAKAEPKAEPKPEPKEDPRAKAEAAAAAANERAAKEAKEAKANNYKYLDEATKDKINDKIKANLQRLEKSKYYNDDKKYRDEIQEEIDDTYGNKYLRYLRKKEEIENNTSLNNQDKIKEINLQVRKLIGGIDESIQRMIDSKIRIKSEEEQKKQRIAEMKKAEEEKEKARADKAKAKAEEKAKAKAAAAKPKAKI